MRMVSILCCLPAFVSAGIESVTLLEPSAKRVLVTNVRQLLSAVNAAEKGQTIMLADGVYDLSALAPLRLRQDSLTLYGMSQDPRKVILKGGGFGSSNTSEELIKIEASSITVAYLTIRDVRGNGLKIQTGACHGILVHNVHFIDICERSIKGPDIPVSRDGVIRFCLFEQVSRITDAIPNLGFNGDYVAGIDMMKIDGWKIQDNLFKNIKGKNGGGRAAVFLWNGSKNAVVERNVFIGCDRAISFGNASSGTMDMEGGIIRNNFIVAGSDISIEVCNSTGGLIAFNTIYSANPAFTRTVFFNGNKGGNVFKNNLVLGKLGVQGGSAPDTAGNLMIQSTGKAANWFRSPVDGDLRLTSLASQAVGKGIPLPSIATDIDGNARNPKPDIGAHEMSATNGIRYPSAPRPASDNRTAGDPIENLTTPGFLWKSGWFNLHGRRLTKG